MAILSGFGAFVSTGVATAFWIATGWSQGSAAAMMAGIFCCIFAAMDDPVPVMRKFGWLLLIVIVAAFVLSLHFCRWLMASSRWCWSGPVSRPRRIALGNPIAIPAWHGALRELAKHADAARPSHA